MEDRYAKHDNDCMTLNKTIVDLVLRPSHPLGHSELLSEYDLRSERNSMALINVAA
jgi:hypothetical protein